MPSRKAWNALSFVFVFSCALPSFASARTDAEIRAAVDEALMQRHPKDGADWWRALGPTAPGVILKMATDTGRAYVRMRLIGALAYWPEDPAAQAFLKEQGDHATDDVIRHAAIRAVGRAQGEGALEWIGRFLDDKNPQTRLTAAETIQKIGGEAAQGKIDSYLKREKVPWLAQRLRGETVVAGKLKVTGSNDDTLAADWFGTWKGQWIEVKGAAPARAELKVERESPTEWSGALTLFHPKKVETLKVTRASGRASRATGALMAGPAEEMALEAELWAARSGPALLLRCAGRSGLFLGARDPGADTP